MESGCREENGRAFQLVKELSISIELSIDVLLKRLNLLFAFLQIWSIIKKTIQLNLILKVISLSELQFYLKERIF